MQEPSALGRIVELVRDLRKRCPWDAAQTPQTLRPYLVEEVMELDHALSSDDSEHIKTELGDLLLHLAFQIVLAEERGDFGAEDVTQTIERKMWRRHPHLFEQGERPESWERSKLNEKDGKRSVLDGLPPTLPALVMALRLQERAAGVGFDWPDAAGPREKIREEIGELESELDNHGDAERLEAEIGDLLFAVVNLARKVNCDPRSALEKANERFVMRFRRIEALAKQRGIEVATAGLEVLDELWEEAKELDG
ncbi:MAG: nucleoside triphosphate pyrophosphohydrolase [Gemmatimonadota bacterium]|nr:MAG: nucleoside triphosphate pyrophosphohydrolase [Gemmatimonadota bacterium]